MANDAAALVRRHLDTPDSAWAVGAFGAIAEFTRDPDEDLLVADFERLTLATARGALRIRLPVAETVPVAYETLSARPERWLHGVGFCLPTAVGTGSRRAALSELGPDGEAILDRDRDKVLFDLGVGAANVDACVRTGDGELITLLRAECGRSILADDNPAMAAIKEASPHRVFVSRLARLEVYQHIGSGRRNIPTPAGPHTHVQPKLLAAGRTHAANIHIPAGLIPCLWLFPPSPLMDGMGREKSFDRRQHAAFQVIMEAYGPPEFAAEKRRARTALDAGLPPRDYTPPTSRAGRAALRVALRQGAAAGDPPLAPALVERWRASFDPTADSDAADAH